LGYSVCCCLELVHPHPHHHTSLTSATMTKRVHLNAAQKKEKTAKNLKKNPKFVVPQKKTLSAEDKKKYAEKNKLQREKRLEANPLIPKTTFIAHHRKHGNPGVPKLRASITPGTVLIVLIGKDAGKRVVFLKDIKGVLVYCGPRRANGVGIRRIPQQYVIATSVKVDISGVNISGVNESFFAKKKQVNKAPKSETEFFKTDKDNKEKKEERDPQFKATADAVAKGVLAAVQKVPMLKRYLSAKFSLSRNVFPHNLKF